ncbi:MAG: hypothetical protein KDC24_08510 [Saprospiraceae bacterium]|nr:hypothetical protein [Saprospiraceae bacterium]
MLNIFKKIRQKLAAENKVTKYLAYAIGEIVLVVIGIMLAIQLNEWNQERVQQKEYHVILENLADEFNRTKDLMDLTITNYESSIDANLALMDLFSPDPGNFSPQRIDTLIGQSAKQAPFYPPQPVLDELINSGKLKSLPSNKLKQYFFEWESNIKWFYFDYELFINFSRNHMDPYITKNWSWKNIDIAEGGQYFKERSKLLASNKELFQSLEFENLIDNNLFHTNRLYQRLTAIDTLIDNILAEIEVSLEQ